MHQSSAAAAKKLDIAQEIASERIGNGTGPCVQHWSRQVPPLAAAAHALSAKRRTGLIAHVRRDRRAGFVWRVKVAIYCVDAHAEGAQVMFMWNVSSR